MIHSAKVSGKLQLNKLSVKKLCQKIQKPLIIRSKHLDLQIVRKLCFSIQLLVHGKPLPAYFPVVPKERLNQIFARL